MNKLNCKVIIYSDVLIQDVSPEGVLDFKILKKNLIVMSEYLLQQKLANEVFESHLNQIVFNALEKVQWEPGTVYQYISIVQFSDSCNCDTNNCSVVHTILEERMRCYGYSDSISLAAD